jgi:hypothetical protein
VGRRGWGTHILCSGMNVRVEVLSTHPLRRQSIRCAGQIRGPQRAAVSRVRGTDSCRKGSGTQSFLRDRFKSQKRWAGICLVRPLRFLSCPLRHGGCPILCVTEGGYNHNSVCGRKGWVSLRVDFQRAFFSQSVKPVTAPAPLFR